MDSTDGGPPWKGLKVLSPLAVAGAVAAVAALAIRPVASFDIGYHLAYGDHFLRTGPIVQTGDFGIYTPLDEKILADPAEWGPGCWFDAETGTYHFVNANWLSQVLFAAVHRLGGMTALCVLRAVLIGAIFGVVAWTMRRAGVGWAWIAAGLILAAVAAFERFDLRPELLGYLILAIQWHLLSEQAFTWRRAVCVVSLQVVFVNVHSYFLFGIAITAAMLIDALLRWLWARSVEQAEAPDLARRLTWLGVAAAGVLAASLCNPWDVRGAILPIETMTYIRRHDILGVGASVQAAGGQARLVGHPWALIGEIIPTFHRRLREYPGTVALGAALVLTAGAAVIAVARRRIGWLLVAAGVTIASVSSRRNIALGGIFLVTLSLVSVADGWRWVIGHVRRPGARVSAIVLSVLAVGCVLAGSILAVAVAGNTWYVRSRLPWRFGLGVSNLMIPAGPAEWINRHRPAGRVWCDFASSSNLFFLTGREMPLLTNTWSHPPYLMRQQMEIAAGLRPLAPFVDTHEVTTVVLRRGRRASPLIGHLARGDAWAPVRIEWRHVVFLRRSGPTAELAKQHGLTERSIDVRPFVDRIAGRDPVPAEAVYGAAMVLQDMGWGDRAIEVLTEASGRWPAHRDILRALARALEQRGDRSRARIAEFLKQRNPGEARKSARKALADYRRAAQVLSDLSDAADVKRVQRKIEAMGKVLPAE